MSRRRRPDCPCADCGTDTNPLPRRGAEYEWYIVHDHIWEAAGMTDGYLCIGCLETRLGRRLTAADFTDVPVNSVAVEWTWYAWSAQRSERLKSRLLDGLSAPSRAW